MFKKEIREVFWQGLFLVSAACAIPGILMLTRVVSGFSYFHVFFPMFQFGLLFWAFLMGASLLLSDRTQNGLLYLLTLPYSRLQLLWHKTLPRFSAALLFFAGFTALYALGGGDLEVISFSAFTLIYWVMFFISLSLSACSDNFLVLFMVSLFSLVLFWILVFWLVRTAHLIQGYILYEVNIRPFFTGEADSTLVGYIGVTAALLVLPLLVSFVLSFRKLDVRPVATFNRRFFTFLGPLFLAGILVFMLLTVPAAKTGYRSFYLTQDLRLITAHQYAGFKVHDGNRVHRISTYDYYLSRAFELSAVELQKALYYETYQGIACIGLDDYARELVYAAPPGRHILSWTLCHYVGTLVFVTRKSDYSAPRLELLDPASGEVLVIPLDDAKLFNLNNQRLFGADVIDGQRFFLMAHWASRRTRIRILRIWEDGRIESIAESEKMPRYTDHRLLVHNEEGILVQQEKDGGYETVRTIPNPKHFTFGLGYYYPSDLSHPPSKELYGWRRIPGREPSKSQEFARLDLQNYQIEEVDSDLSRLYYVSADAYYCVQGEIWDGSLQDLEVYRLEEGKLTLLKAFENLRPNPGRTFQFFPAGVLLQNGSKTEIYAYPDLRRLEFKKLR
jgi:hypothetical protein